MFCFVYSKCEISSNLNKAQRLDCWFNEQYVYTKGCCCFGDVFCINKYSLTATHTDFVVCIFRNDGGSFNMAVFSVDVTSVVELGKDPNGQLSVSSVSCGASVGSVDMQFHGGARYSRTERGERLKG